MGFKALFIIIRHAGLPRWNYMFFFFCLFFFITNPKEKFRREFGIAMVCGPTTRRKRSRLRPVRNRRRPKTSNLSPTQISAILTSHGTSPNYRNRNRSTGEPVVGETILLRPLVATTTFTTVREWRRWRCRKNLQCHKQGKRAAQLNDKQFNLI